MTTTNKDMSAQLTLRDSFKHLGFKIDRSDFDQTTVTIKPLSSVFITGTLLLILGLLFIPSISGIIAYFFMDSKSVSAEEEVSYFSLAISLVFGIFGIISFAKGVNRLFKYTLFNIEISSTEIIIRRREDILMRRYILKNPTGLFIREEDDKIALLAKNEHEEILLIEEQNSERVKYTFQTLIDRLNIN